jgi:molybdenum-dependent DNA-binding transcriptional regulator ModE
MDEVTRGEFDLLKTIVASNQARLEGIDSGGTKGVAVVQSQLVDLVKDMAELKAEVDKRFDAHKAEHQLEARDRAAGRRYAVTTALVVIGLLVSILALVLRHGSA